MLRLSLLGLPPDSRPGTRLLFGVHSVHRDRRSRLHDELDRVCRSADQERQFLLLRLRKATENVAGYPFFSTIGLADSAAYAGEAVVRVLDDRSQPVVPTVTAADRSEERR